MDTGWFRNVINSLRSEAPVGARFHLVRETGDGFYSWGGKLYQSDIIRSCIRPKVRAVGKLSAKHVREYVRPDGKKDFKVNPEAYMRFLLEEPNPYMTGQMLQEKLAGQLALNNNAFALIVRGSDGYPAEIYPLPAVSVQAVYDRQMNLFLRFLMPNGKFSTFPYSDIIHLRQDYCENDIFGESPMRALSPLMEIVGTTDQGIVKAIKNSSIIQWLLKFNNALRPEDLKANAAQFAENYLSLDSTSIGVAAVDTKAEAVRVEPKDYVPNAAQMDRTVFRIMSFFGTNEKIVQSKYSEDEWISYYEAEIEPTAIQIAGEYTRKLFSRRERGWGNHIYFESSSLQFASMQTKLKLESMVDRGALSPNEWRAVFGLAPTEGGDQPIRRLDTAPVKGDRDET